MAVFARPLDVAAVDADVDLIFAFVVFRPPTELDTHGGGLGGGGRRGQRKLGDDRAGLKRIAAAVDAEDAEIFFVELDHQCATWRCERAGIDDHARSMFGPDARVMDVAEDDEAGGRVVFRGHLRGHAGRRKPRVNHRERTAWVREEAKETGELMSEAAVGGIVFGRQTDADRAKDPVAGFELVPSAGRKRIAERVDAAAIFGKIRAPRCEVFKKHISVGEPDLAIGEEEFVDGRDVGVVVAGDEKRLTGVRGEKRLGLGDQLGAICDDLGVKGVAVDDDAVSAVEQRAEHGEGANLAGGVVEV